jgi:hypothetical protein
MPIAGGASWFVAVAAFALIAVSVGSYFYHRRQLDSIAARHLRLVVAGPGQLQVGMPSTFNLMATTVTGEPWAESVEWSLSTPDGKRLVDRKEPTDDQGRLTMIVPADMDLPTRSRGLAQLAVIAGGGANPPSVALPLPIRPARYLTRLWLDRPSYRPGETVYYRSLTVSRYSLVAHRTLPVEFEILDPKSVPLPDSRIDGLTDHGVGNGSYRLSDSLPAGAYTLVARTWEDVFPEERLVFEVIGRAVPHVPAKPNTSPAGAGASPLPPPASSDQKIAIAPGRGVFDAGAPLEINVRATKDRLPLVITARVRGLLVGQQMLVTSPPDQAAKGNTVSIPLDEQVAGVIRLTAYDYSQSPPKALAERLVYRRPRRLVVRAAEGKKPVGELSLSVQDEKGRPVAAAMGVTVVDGGNDKTSRPGRCGPDLLHALLSDGDLENPAALERVDLNPSDAEAATLGLMLGGQGQRAAGKPRAAPPPPVLFDNLNELRAQYEATLSEYRAKRTHAVNALIMLSFFGGLALALLVTMLALLRIVRGSRLWLPTVVAMVCCVVVTAVSNEPSRMKPVEAAAVGFAPCLPQADVEPKEQNRREPAGTGAETADSKLQNLAEKLSKTEGDTEELKSDRFVVRQYPLPGMARSIAGEGGVKPLAWYPLVVAGADGRVALPGLAPAAGKAVRLFIDALSDGRIESCELLVK